MIETWNGENFVDWLRTHMSDNPLFQIVKNENTFSTTSLEWYNNCWQEELKKWNGSNNFKSHWTKVHNNTHNILYLYWDIVHDIGKTKQVSQFIQDNSYMWISNIWDNGQLHNKNDANTIITKFNKFTNNIGTNVLLHGKDTTGDNIWKYYNE